LGRSTRLLAGLASVLPTRTRAKHMPVVCVAATDDAPHVSRADPTGTDQFDGVHQPTDLAIGGCACDDPCVTPGRSVDDAAVWSLARSDSRCDWPGALGSNCRPWPGPTWPRRPGTGGRHQRPGRPRGSRNLDQAAARMIRTRAVPTGAQPDKEVIKPHSQTGGRRVIRRAPAIHRI
jgi:hypothetical protein